MINGLSLFTGIGGLDVALSKYVNPIAYCEIEPYCQSVLLSRMQEGALPKAPIWDDIRTLPTDQLPKVDVIYGGFPCQDISVAGLRKGLEGERSGLFFEILRVAKEVKPAFIFLENVAGITTKGGLRVVREVAEMGYDCRWCVISAASVGAMHRRNRWFLLAHSKHHGTPTSKGGGHSREIFISGDNEQKKSIGKIKRASMLSADVANSSSTRLERFGGRTISDETKQSKLTVQSENDSNSKSIASGEIDKKTDHTRTKDPRRGNSRECCSFESRIDWQKTVYEMGKHSDGISFHVDRLRALGNAVVPQQAKKAFELLLNIYTK